MISCSEPKINISIYRYVESKTTRICIRKWWSRWDLNPQSSLCKSGALPIMLLPHILSWRCMRILSATRWFFPGRRTSSQSLTLSYSIKYGRHELIWTDRGWFALNELLVPVSLIHMPIKNWWAGYLVVMRPLRNFYKSYGLTDWVFHTPLIKLVDHIAAHTPDFYRRTILLIRTKITRYNLFTVLLLTCIFFMVRRQDFSFIAMIFLYLLLCVS